MQSRSGATLSLAFAGVTGTPTIQIVGISGATFTGPLTTYQIVAPSIDVSFTRTSNGSVGGLVTVTHVLKNQAGVACGGQTTFTFRFNPLPN